MHRISADAAPLWFSEAGENLSVTSASGALSSLRKSGTHGEVAEKDRLQFESDQTAARLIRAEKLTNGLNSEGVRWKATIDTLAQEHTNLIGDCFLSCACISYYGGFTGSYREKLIDLWLEKTKQLKIPASGKFSLGKTLGDPVMIREWQNQGLPTDDVSVNNGILVDKCRRWPLMIDPQMQANAWLRKKEEANNVQITTMNDTNLLRVLDCDLAQFRVCGPRIT